QMMAERLKSLIGYQFTLRVASLHRDIGKRIDRIAIRHQLGHDPARVRILQKRPVLLLRNALHQQVEIGLEPYRDAMLGDSLARLRIHEGAASCRDDARSFAQQPLDDTLLERTKFGFAV